MTKTISTFNNIHILILENYLKIPKYLNAVICV